ncbi:MAG TPA: hypothetical protein PLR25_12735 [Planctomycetaceae bacterium]|nr:hypothetical protein [Planctomycetaceae bacterium]
MKHSIIDWESPAPRIPHAHVESIEHFSARGMQWVYGRGCTFGRMANFNLDAWRNRSGDIFVRFWSRNEEVDDLAFCVSGVPPSFFENQERGKSVSDAWLPQRLRDEYEEWIDAGL